MCRITSKAATVLKKKYHRKSLYLDRQAKQWSQCVRAVALVCLIILFQMQAVSKIFNAPNFFAQIFN